MIVDSSFIIKYDLITALVFRIYVLILMLPSIVFFVQIFELNCCIESSCYIRYEVCCMFILCSFNLVRCNTENNLLSVYIMYIGCIILAFICNNY